MRLIGGKDYYDNGLAFGRDDTITFVRGRADDPSNTHEGTIPDIQLGFRMNVKKIGKIPTSWNVSRKGWRIDYPLAISKMVVVVAGKRYNGIRVIEDKVHYHYFWTKADLDGYLRERGLAVSTSPQWEWTRKKTYTDEERVTEWFDSKDISKLTYDWVISNRATILFAVPNPNAPVYGKDDPYTYQFDTDCLKSIEFYRRLDPVQAFQEIQMWIGGVLPKPGPAMVEITDDKIKAAKHGMDKWSFRKPPEKK